MRLWCLKLSLEKDILALKWLLRFGILYLGLVHWVWNLDWFNKSVLNPYRELIIKLLVWIFSSLGQACRGRGMYFYLSDAPLIFHINRYCTGIFPGFFIFTAVILTLPAPSLRAKLIWFMGGGAGLVVANMLRLVTTIAIASADPDRFEVVHVTLSNLLMLVGCGLSLWGAVALSLKPYGVRVFGHQLESTSVNLA